MEHRHLMWLLPDFLSVWHYWPHRTVAKEVAALLERLKAQIVSTRAYRCLGTNCAYHFVFNDSRTSIYWLYTAEVFPQRWFTPEPLLCMMRPATGVFKDEVCVKMFAVGITFWKGLTQNFVVKDGRRSELRRTVCIVMVGRQGCCTSPCCKLLYGTHSCSRLPYSWVTVRLVLVIAIHRHVWHLSFVNDANFKYIVQSRFLNTVCRYVLRTHVFSSFW